jgi:hypothetical protein
MSRALGYGKGRLISLGILNRRDSSLKYNTPYIYATNCNY